MPTASCHCGAVKIEMAAMTETVTRCTCSICRRYGAQWAYCTRKTARVVRASGATTAYLWNDRVIEFHHCNTCGCMTHYEDVDRSEDGRVAVNARMLPPEDMDEVKIRTFDGADTWKYID